MKVPIVEYQVSIKISGKTRFRHLDQSYVCLHLSEIKEKGANWQETLAIAYDKVRDVINAIEKED